MIRHFTPALVILSLSILFSSCEEPIDFNINEKERLVIISNFTEKNNLIVFVSKTKSILSTDPSSFITDATVMVFSGNDLLEVLELSPGDEGKKIPPRYISKDIHPKIGQVYTIKVVAPGFDPVTATSSIPVPVPIESVAFSPTVDEDDNHEVVVNFEVTVSFHDPPNVKNYYHLIFYQELIPFLLGPAGDTIKGDAQLTTPIKIQMDDPNLPLIRNFDNRSFLIKDDTFNGDKVSFPFSGSYSFSRMEFIPGSFFVELRTVPEDYYLYHTTLTRQANSGHPLSEGVVIYDNIVNGEGIFAGYSSVFNSFQLNN